MPTKKTTSRFTRLLTFFKKHPFLSGIGFVILFPFFCLFAICLYYGIWALTFDLNKVSQMPATSIIYDRNGHIIQRLYEQHRLLVDSSQIPPVLENAVIATEDQRFRYHLGFDPISITRAIIFNIFSDEAISGASTITQQLARNSADMFEKTIDRKLKELFLAIRIELTFSKKEILTFYLNRIYFGGNLYGIGAASDSLFGKNPKDLTLSESSLLAGIVAGPNILSPHKNVENVARAKKTRAKTLDRMVEQGFITPEEARLAKAEPLRLRPLNNLPGSYITKAVMDRLPDFLTRKHIFQGGLHIHTTIDLNFQEAARQELDIGLTRLENSRGYTNLTRSAFQKNPSSFSTSATPPYVQGAFVAISNQDGAILAAVGGRDFSESSFNRAFYARRQIGSTVKPFIYVHAFNTLNFSAFTEIDKSVFDLKKPNSTFIPAGPKPSFISTREALQTSNNHTAIRVGMATGLPSFAYFMERVSGQPITPTPSVCLGTCELTPFEITSAYTLFANYGVILKPYLIQKVLTHKNQLVYQHIDERERLLSPQVSFQLNHLLQGVVEKGTARSLKQQYRLKEQIGGKTGTTNAYKDSWFVGYTTEITTGLWVGFDRPKTIMHNGYSSRIVLPIWGRIMKEANKHYPAERFYPPKNVSLARNKKEKKFLFIFKSEVVEGPEEYIRDNQRSNALARLDRSTPLNQIHERPQKSWGTRLWEWAFPPQPKDKFKSVYSETEEYEAIINDTSETKAPRAEPVE